MEFKTFSLEFEAGPLEFEARPLEFEARLLEFEAGPLEFEAGPLEFEAGPLSFEARPLEFEAGYPKAWPPKRTLSSHHHGDVRAARTPHTPRPTVAECVIMQRTATLVIPDLDAQVDCVHRKESTGILIVSKVEWFQRLWP